MSDIKFDIYESPANDGEKKKYHVRNTNKQTIHSKDLIHEATLYTSVSRSDWAAVVEGLIDILSEKLGDGKRIHINGLGYYFKLFCAILFATYLLYLLCSKAQDSLQ